MNSTLENIGISLEQLLAASSAENSIYFRALAEAIPDVLYVVRRDGVCEYINQRFFDYTGLPRQQVDSWTTAIHPEDLGPLQSAWAEVATSGETFEYEYRMLMANHAYRWFWGRAKALLDDRGAIVKWFGISTDIHNRKRAEDAMRSQEALLRKVLELVPIGVRVANQDIELTIINRYARQLYDKTPVVGMPRWRESKTYRANSGARVRENDLPLIKAVKNGSICLDEEFVVEGFNHLRRILRVSAVPVNNMNGEIVGGIAVSQDITEQKEQAELLQRCQNEIEQLRHEKMSLLAVNAALREQLEKSAVDDAMPQRERDTE